MLRRTVSHHAPIGPEQTAKEPSDNPNGRFKCPAHRKTTDSAVPQRVAARKLDSLTQELKISKLILYHGKK